MICMGPKSNDKCFVRGAQKTQMTKEEMMTEDEGRAQ